jgi:hypothetical protein
VAASLAALADRGAKAATIARRLVVFSQAHKAADLPSRSTSSRVSRTHAGTRRTIGTTQTGKAPAVVEDLKRLLVRCPTGASACGIGRSCCSASPAAFGASSWSR